MTSTEFLIEVVERFQEAEPESVMVVWTDGEGYVCCKTNCGHTQTIGMAEYAKHLAITAISEPKI